MSREGPASPGWRTHLMFAGFDGVVEDGGDHWVVRSPRSPGYYWGNFLLYERFPTDADFGPWMQRFDEAIVSHAPRTGHRAFGIAPAAPAFEAPQAFVQAGFEVYCHATLLLGRGQLAAAPPAPALAIRPLDLSCEAEAVVELSAACNDDGYESEGYRAFRRHQMQRYAAMAEAGLGHWWGVLDGDRVVAGLGLFGRDGLGRFQHVETHPALRRRGLCRALVHAACTAGLARWPQLVICADPDDVAIGIYRAAGFRDHDRLWLLERRAPEDRPGAA